MDVNNYCPKNPAITIASYLCDDADRIEFQEWLDSLPNREEMEAQE